jgi:cytochrome oxidase assembly protein ShyY1
LVFLLAVIVFAYGTYLLGRWQFHRSEDRKARNAVIERNLAQEPVPVDDLLAVGRPPSDADEWSRVTATGVYDASAAIVLRYQTRNGRSGADVITPLVRVDGTAILIDRGWFQTDASGLSPADLPAPPGGTVEIVGWVRLDAAGGSTKVSDGSTRAVSSTAIGETLDYQVLGGWIDLESETPAATEELVAAELPDLGSGPHFFYGMQWWFFGLLALGGFVYLAIDERREAKPSQTAQGTAVDRE